LAEVFYYLTSRIQTYQIYECF